MKKRLRQGAQLIVADPRRDRPRAHAARRGRLPPAAPPRHQRRAPHRDGARHRHRGAGRRGLRPRALRAGRVRRVGAPSSPQERNSPEAMAEYTGVDPAAVRAAARLYATGGNAAIYYGLGVTEHSQGSTTVMAIANLAMATGNIGRPGVGVNPLRGQNNVQGSCDMGSFPHELVGYRHISDDGDAAALRGDLELHPRPRAGPAHPEHARRRGRGHLPRALHPGRGHPAVRPRHPARRRRPRGDGLRRRPGPLPERDRELRPRLPARLDLPREGRHLHQRRAAHPAACAG